MARRKIVISVYLEPDQAEGLRAMSRETRIPMAALVRMFVSAGLSKERYGPTHETIEGALTRAGLLK